MLHHDTRQSTNHGQQGEHHWHLGGTVSVGTAAKFTPSNGVQAAAIAPADVAAGSTPTKAEFDAVVAKLNAVTAALRNIRVINDRAD